MKRGVLLLAVLLTLCLSACRKEPARETQPEQTAAETTMPAETEAQPELETVTAQINGIPAVLETLSRGDTVDVVEAFDERHYTVKLETGYGLVEKNLVRLESEPPFEPWTGYAYHNAAVYDNYRLAGVPGTLASNTKVEVLDDLGWCLLVSHDDKAGYMKPESLAKSPRGGGSGNAPADSGGSSGQESTGEDGGDIWLQHSAEVTLLSVIAPQKGSVSGRAAVLADGTDVVLGYFDRGDRVPVLKETLGKEQLTVYLDGLCACIFSDYVGAEGEEVCETWEGISKSNAVIYEDFWMIGSPVDRLNADTPITVLYELEACYLAEAGGVTGYIPKEMVVPASVEPKPSQPQSSNGNTAPAPVQPGAPSEDKDSGNAPQKPESGNTLPAETQPAATQPSGGNSGTGSGNTDPEWTPPML